MSLFRLALVLVFAALGTSAYAQAPTGRVTGRVLDAINAQPLPGVTVTVVGTSQVAHTDLDGRYVLTLPVGAHQLKVAMSGFAERTVSVDVQTSMGRDVDVVLSLAKYSEEITVQAEVGGEASSLAALLVERRRASTINDSMGGQEMKANADSNAAAALQRVTGLSVVDNQYVFVRGLGERYSNTTLNGATLPSTEPERKVVSLDMFPAGLLESVSVVKSYTADRSADFAGGLVEVIPVRLPTRQMASFSYSFGGNSQSWGQDILDHGAGGRDWLGLTNSSRRMPSDFPDKRIIRGGIFTPELGVSQADLERYGESLVNEWTPGTISGRPQQGFSAAYGNRWGKFGLSGSVNHSYKQDYQEEDQVYYSTDNAGNLSPFSTYDYRVGSTRATLAALVNAAYAMNANNRVNFQLFSTDKGKRETRTFEGFNDDIARNIRNARLLWEEENLRTYQFGGDHLFPAASNSRLEWRASFARSSRDEPDIRETLYQELTANSGVYTIADESQSGLRMFNDLDEDAWDVSASWNAAFTGIRGLPAMLKFGPSVSNRQRDFQSRRFRFVPINTTRFSLAQTPEQLFTPENIGPRYELREETRSTDFYDAEQRVTAGFGQLDLSLTARARIIGGVRVERFRQTVNTIEPFSRDIDEEPEIITGEIAKTDIFPALNLVYDLGGNKNLRVGFSQTVNRPEFRELAPFEFTDIVGGRAVVGNPELERSLIRNVDVRWEWFPGATEVIAASLFFKDFDQPIERFVEPTAQLRTSFTNAKSARNVGFELEARREFSDHVVAGGNYTFVDSSIELQSFQTNVLTSLERPLAGTSKHIFNAMFEVNVAPVTARFLVNTFSDRIVDVGSLGLPDIFEEGRTTLDLVVSGRIGRSLTVRFAAENLGNSPVRFLQGSETHREFTYGRTFAVQFSVSGR